MATGSRSGSSIGRGIPVLAILLVVVAVHVSILWGFGGYKETVPAVANPLETVFRQPQGSPVKLVFIHHSTGENWLADDNGGLGIALRDNNYFVSDTNYGWGPEAIGDRTDIGHWYDWFAGPNRETYLDALYGESAQHSSYSRLASDPGGPNAIVMFKSCFPNSNLGGSPNDPPTSGDNPLRGQDAGSQYMTVGNAKGIYNDLLAYFASHQEKMFIAITAPPLASSETDATSANNARAFNNWLVNNWLAQYPYNNVAVFDFYNVLTSNGGNANTNDLGVESGNHHRLWNGAIQHIQTVNNNMSAYPSDPYDSHPSPAGNQKATAEFVGFLNTVFSLWHGQGLWHEAVDLGNGWKWVNWFGYLNTNYDPWIYHEDHGWLYPFGTSTADLVFWDPQMNAFWWTTQTQYPYVYRFSDGAWLYYQVGSSDPRWFYNYSQGAWESN
jgi:hypothetical protein